MGRERAIYNLERLVPSFRTCSNFMPQSSTMCRSGCAQPSTSSSSNDWILGRIATLASYDLSLDLIDLIIKTRDVIAREQRRLATIPPPVQHNPRCRSHQQGRCESAWAAAWILNIGRQVIHVDPLFRLEPHGAADAIQALEVPGMSDVCFRAYCNKGPSAGRVRLYTQSM